MISLLSSINLSNATGRDAVRISASQIVTVSEAGYPSVNNTLDCFDWNGGAFSLLGSYVSVPYATVLGSCHILWHANHLWTIGKGFGIGGSAGVAAFSWDGATFAQTAGRTFTQGGTLTVSSPTRMVTDGTYVYFCQQQSKVVGNSGPPMFQPIYAALNYLVALAYSEPSFTLSGTLQISSFNGADMIAQGGAIFYRYAAYLRKMTFNGSVFSESALLNDANLHANSVMDGDGTYIYAKHTDESSILVYNNTPALVTTFDTGKAISYIKCDSGSVYVTFADETREYTFDGANFTLVDSAAYSIRGILV